MFERAREWVEAAGVTRLWGKPPQLDPQCQSAPSRHLSHGRRPATSVTNRDGQIHGISNLYVADGSTHVTNGGFNPVLTITRQCLSVLGKMSSAVGESAKTAPTCHKQ
jgi:choline dehydrogenase-like flavoprotein